MAYNTITLKSNGQYLQEEAKANAAITPGMLLQIETDGDVSPHATNGGYATPKFAVEDDLQGKGISDVYAAAALVFWRNYLPGEEVYALLGPGQTVAISDKLMSYGGEFPGTLAKYTDTIHDDSSGNADTVTIRDRKVVAEAMEAITTDGSSDAWAPVRIRVRIV